MPEVASILIPVGLLTLMQPLVSECLFPTHSVRSRDNQAVLKLKVCGVAHTKQVPVKQYPDIRDVQVGLDDGFRQALPVTFCEEAHGQCDQDCHR